MIPREVRLQFFGILFGILLALPSGSLGLVPFPADFVPPAAESSPADGSQAEMREIRYRSALLFFFSNRSVYPLPIDPSHIRLSGQEILATDLEPYGYDFVPYLELEPLLQEWRIRSGNDLHFDFLAESSRELSLDRLMVADLVVYADRLLLLIRAIIPDSGLMAGVDVAETLIPPEVWDSSAGSQAAWDKEVAKISGELARRWLEVTPRKGQQTLVVLPVSPAGIEAAQADLSTHCLLRSLLRLERWVMPDPSLVVSSLLREGYDPKRLEPMARRSLMSRFNAESILQSHLLSYGIKTEQRGPRYESEDDDGAVGSSPRGVQLPLYLALMMINGDSGRIIAAGAEYMEPESSIGLFGVIKGVMMSRRIQKGTDRLVSRLPYKEDL